MEYSRSISGVEALSAYYLAVLSVLIFLLAFCLWRTRRTIATIYISLAIAGLTCFYLSRLSSVFWQNTFVKHGPLHVLSLTLNLGCFFFAAVFLLKIHLEERANTKRQVAENRPDEEGGIASSIIWKLVYFAALAAVIYWTLTFVNVLSFSRIGFFDFVILAATARLVCLIYTVLNKIRFEAKIYASATVYFLSSSWILFNLVAHIDQSNAVVLLGFARFSDILASFSMMTILHSKQMMMGLRYRDQAVISREEAEKTKEELTRLNKIAADIYEDSNELIKRQKAQTRLLMKRVESLERILKIGVTIQKRKDLKELLQMIVKLVKENIGFNTVILRLINEKTQNFETKAFAGLSEEVADTVVNFRIPVTEFEKMIEPRFRISESYFIRNNSPWYGESLKNDESVLVEDSWSEIDMLIVPLIEDNNKTIGYLSVEDPQNTEISVVDAIENLEDIASLAVIAIRNARFIRELEEKNEKLRTYAEKLTGLNRMKSSFVATISHEFRTPLTSIKAYCETLLRNADKVDRRILKEFLVVIDEESDRLMNLIEDILDFSQMESGAVKFERSPCNLNEIITVAARELEKNFKSKQITLHQELPDSEVKIRAERDLVKQLIINLLHNASKFTSESGNVWIRLEEEMVSARIVVEDDGIGIPEDHLEKIFEHFHQVDNSLTRKHGGSGLGLAICRNIVDWHDGRIWVENMPGRGARFVVVLPKRQVVVHNQVASFGCATRRFEVERYLELLIEMVAELLGSRRASIMLLDKSKKELRIGCAIGLDEEIVENAKIKVGEGIAGKVIREGKTYCVEDIEKDPRIKRKNNNFLYSSKSFLSVPIKSRDRAIGVVNVANPSSKDKFDREDCTLLEVFVERMTVSLERLDQFAKVSVDFEKVRTTLKLMLDAKRHIEVQHAEAIAALVLKTAGLLGLGEKEKAILQYALNIYDLGLAKVGYHIIKKPGELSPGDRRAIENHTIVGTELLKAIETMPEVRDVVLYHHENFDGTGYPGRLSGGAIPIEARIIRVSDSFRALISHRPYQKQYTVGEALEVLKHRSGTFFDPRVVEAFVKAVEGSEGAFETKGKKKPSGEKVGSRPFEFSEDTRNP